MPYTVYKNEKTGVPHIKLSSGATVNTETLLDWYWFFGKDFLIQEFKCFYNQKNDIKEILQYIKNTI